MNLFSKNEINTGRQFEFDLAKAICILGMVFVHCFEEFPLVESAYEGSLYYTLIIVLDALFGAGTFMICLGIGLTYTKNNMPDDFIKRGLITFLLGYILNIIRFVLPTCYYLFTDELVSTLKYLLGCFLYTDIMQFAGLSFILFGLLKKLKISDIGLLIIALVMSICGSFFRFIEVGSYWSSEIVGLFVGTVNVSLLGKYYAPFALLNWFIIVVFGYFFGKLIRRCENIEKLYAILTPISGAIVITYMIIAIPNRLGMMCGDESYYFQMTTYETFFIMMGAVFAFGLYHYISKLFNEKVKNFIIGLSKNINKTYCIHWVIIGFLSVIFYEVNANGLENYMVILIALLIYIVSSVLAEIFKKIRDKKKENINVAKN